MKSSNTLISEIILKNMFFNFLDTENNSKQLTQLICIFLHFSGATAEAAAAKAEAATKNSNSSRTDKKVENRLKRTKKESKNGASESENKCSTRKNSEKKAR